MSGNPGDTAPRDGTLVLATTRENGRLGYGLLHYRHNRDGSEGWYDGNEPTDRSPVRWWPLPGLAA